MKKGLLMVLGIITIAIAFLVGYGLIFGQDGFFSTGWNWIADLFNTFLGNLTGSDGGPVNDFNTDNDGSGGLNIGDNPFGG